jgi:phosphoribosylanthranilate isomerase
LSPENVAEAIRTVRPFAVDACSCLEAGKGVKDPEKLRRFIENAKNA